MALNARIAEVVTYEGGATLVLEAREPEKAPAGQSRMEILNPTVIPNVGDELMGGSHAAIIISGEVKFPYLRQGYTKLIQNW